MARNGQRTGPEESGNRCNRRVAANRGAQIASVVRAAPARRHAVRSAAGAVPVEFALLLVAYGTVARAGDAHLGLRVALSAVVVPWLVAGSVVVRAAL